jgi:hypothetical protein
LAPTSTLWIEDPALIIPWTEFRSCHAPDWLDAGLQTRQVSAMIRRQTLDPAATGKPSTREKIGFFFFWILELLEKNKVEESSGSSRLK